MLRRDPKFSADDEEESVGAYLLVNWDDDDADGVLQPTGWTVDPVPDLAEEETNYSEDNLAKLKIDFTNLPTEGIVYLNVTENPDCIKLWEDPAKGDASKKLGIYNAFELSDPAQRAKLQSYIQLDFCRVKVDPIASLLASNPSPRIRFA